MWCLNSDCFDLWAWFTARFHDVVQYLFYSRGIKLAIYLDRQTLPGIFIRWCSELRLAKSGVVVLAWALPTTQLKVALLLLISVLHPT